MNSIKNVYLFLIFLMAVPLFATNETAVSTSYTNNANSIGSHETVEATVLKAYVLSDLGAEFRAYVVEWRGHEVIVSDMMAGSNYKEGDTIKFLAMRMPLPSSVGTNEVLNFQVMPHPHGNRVIAFAELYKPKTPSYIDCHADGYVLYPGGVNVNWDDLQQPDNPVSKLLDEVQRHKETENVVVLVRPQSVKLFRAIRNLVSIRPIDVRYEAVDAETKLDADDPGKSIAVVPQVQTSTAGAVPTNRRAVITSRRPVFFECRDKQVFIIDKDGLDAQVAKLLSTLNPDIKGGDRSQFLQAIQGKEIGNENYKVNLTYLQVGMVALEPRADATGDNSDRLDMPDGKFQTMLLQLDPKGQDISFLVRDDSFGVFRKARAIAAQRGFNTGWELLGAGEPIKFGN